MKKEIIITCALSILLISTPLVSSIEYTKIKESKTNIITIQQNAIFNEPTKLYKNFCSIKNIQTYLKNLINNEITQSLKKAFQKIELTDMNQHLLQIIGALSTTLLFFIITQPFFLEAIVSLGYESILFPGLLLFILLLEVAQKYFVLKSIGLYDDLVTDNIDGAFNFFSIVFLLINFKIDYSYLPQYIVQYSGVFTRSFYYLLMFTLPILFTYCLSDSIDLIDWNGNEQIIKKIFPGLWINNSNGYLFKE